MNLRSESDPRDLLWQLVDRRAAAGVDKQTIDRELWQRFGAQRAVMFTDLCGFSRRSAEFGITHFLQLIREVNRLTAPIIGRYGGRILKECGDSALVVFQDADDGLACSIAMQHACQAESAGRPLEEQLLLCIGLGFGAVLCPGHDVWGTEVNAASKLGEDMACRDEILVTRGVKDGLRRCHDATFRPFPQAPAGVDECFAVEYPRRTAHHVAPG